MERLIVKNFGPIKEADIELRKFNVFIGNTSTGKSTIAKLVAILTNIEVEHNISLSELFKDYNINFRLDTSTVINLESDNLHFEANKGKIKLNNKRTTEATSKAFALLKFTISTYRLLPYKDIALFKRKDFFEPTNKFLNDLAVVFQTNKKVSELIRKIASNIELINTPKKRLNYNKLADESLDLVKILEDSIFKNSKAVYIPAERIFFSTLESSIYSLLNEDVNLPKCIINFGKNLEKVKKANKDYEFEFLGVKYVYDSVNGYRILLNDKKTKIKLENASSGFQSVIPLLLVCGNELDEFLAFNKLLTIEEPEQNLYPTMQRGLLDYLVRKTNPTDHKLVITTHSPYFLNIIDIYLKVSKFAKDNPDKSETLAAKLDKNLWIDINDISCYYFEDGKVYDIVDRENSTLQLDRFDKISADLNDLYNDILNVVYAKA